MIEQELKTSDFAVVAEILRNCELHLGQSVPGAPKWSDEMILSEIADSFSLAVRNSSGQIEAFIFLRFVVDAFEISYLATALQARRKGLMRGLLARAAELARGRQMALWLEVHEKNEAARHLYEKFGFTQVGQRPYYYADRGTAILYNYQ